MSRDEDRRRRRRSFHRTNLKKHGDLDQLSQFSVLDDESAFEYLDEDPDAYRTDWDALEPRPMRTSDTYNPNALKGKDFSLTPVAIPRSELEKVKREKVDKRGRALFFGDDALETIAKRALVGIRLTDSSTDALEIDNIMPTPEGMGNRYRHSALELVRTVIDVGEGQGPVHRNALIVHPDGHWANQENESITLGAAVINWFGSVWDMWGQDKLRVLIRPHASGDMQRGRITVYQSDSKLQVSQVVSANVYAQEFWIEQGYDYIELEFDVTRRYVQIVIEKDTNKAGLTSYIRLWSYAGCGQGPSVNPSPRLINGPPMIQLINLTGTSDQDFVIDTLDYDYMMVKITDDNSIAHRLNCYLKIARDPTEAVWFAGAEAGSWVLFHRNYNLGSGEKFVVIPCPTRLIGIDIKGAVGAGDVDLWIECFNSVEPYGRDYEGAGSGTTVNADVDIIANFGDLRDWDRMVVNLSNDDGANTLTYTLKTLTNYAGSIEYQETTGTLAPGIIGQFAIAANNVAQAKLYIKSTTTDVHADYSYEMIKSRAR